ncbi:MAG: hypothetical protein ACOC56_01640 [Atribacterota bacterium]
MNEYERLKLLKNEYQKLLEKESKLFAIELKGNTLESLEMKFNDEIVEIVELNDEDMLVDIEVDNNHFFYANGILTKNSIGVPATADFLGIVGRNQDDLVYENEIHYKIVKNRLGGRIGLIDKLYFDSRSLKLYDVTEMDNWMEDVEKSGDSRNIWEQEE